MKLYNIVLNNMRPFKDLDERTVQENCKGL